MKRWLWVLLLCAVAIGGIVYGLRPQPVPVEIATAKSGPLRVTVEEEGKTRLRLRYVVSAPMAGTMSRVRWKAGDSVRAGDVVANLTPTGAPFLEPRTRETIEARVRVAESALDVARARVRPLQEKLKEAQLNVDYWQGEQARQEALFKEGLLPSQELERTKSELARANAAATTAKATIDAATIEIDSAKAEVGAAKAQLQPASGSTGPRQETLPIAIPAAGRVIRVIQESEAVVTPGTPIVEIGDARALEVVVEVLSPDAVQIGPGTRVLLTGWGGAAPLEARVRVIEPGGFTKVSALGVEEQRVRVVADITSPETEWGRLGDGYRVEAGFILWETEKTLQIPSNALFRFQNGWAVFAVENGAAHRRVVEVGRRNGLAAEILSGIQEGATVIAHPDETVEEGKAVAPR